MANIVKEVAYEKIYLTRICRNHSPGRLLPAGKRPAQARSQRRRQRNRQHRRQGTHPAEPKRIVFLNASNLEIFASIGGKAVGRPTSTSYPNDIKESIKDIPEVGMIHAPNLEKIMSLKPDLVVGTNVPFHVMLRKPLEMAGVPLYLNMINSYEDVLKSIDDFGCFAGRDKEAAVKRAQIEKEYAALTQDVQKGRGPKVLIIFGSPDSFNMSTKKSFGGDLAERLGAVNIADKAENVKDSSYIPLSMEFVAKENPDIVMLITMGGSKEILEKLRANMRDNAIWHDVNAVKNNRVYQLPPSLFTVNPGTHTIDAMKIMKEYMYGEAK